MVKLKGFRQRCYLLPLGSLCLGSSLLTIRPTTAAEAKGTEEPYSPVAALTLQAAEPATSSETSKLEGDATLGRKRLSNSSDPKAIAATISPPQRIAPETSDSPLEGAIAPPIPAVDFFSSSEPGKKFADPLAKTSKLDALQTSDSKVESASVKLVQTAQELLEPTLTNPANPGPPAPASPSPSTDIEASPPPPSTLSIGIDNPVDGPSELFSQVPPAPPTEPIAVPAPPTEPDNSPVNPDATGEELPTVPEDETLVPTPEEEEVAPESLPPAISEEEASEGDDASPEEPEEDATEESGDPELGVLRLRERELSLTQPPIKVPVYLLFNSSYLTNSNTRASEDPVEDQLFRSTVSLTASPILGRRTSAYGTVQGNLFRYGDLSRLDYNELRLRAGVRHVLSRRVIGELGWTHRQLFFREDGDRFLSDHAVSGVISRRDSGILGKSTALSSFYRVRASFADPKTSNRVVNTLGTTLSYDITPRLKASLTGLGVVTSFTRQSRHDVYGQALASLSYSLAKNTRLSIFGALNRGGSVDERVDFDNALLGVSFSSSLKLF